MERQHACMLALLWLVLGPALLASAQFLKTTCPTVKPAVCPGQCSNPSASGIPGQGTCSRKSLSTQRKLAEAAQATPDTKPQAVSSSSAAALDAQEQQQQEQQVEGDSSTDAPWVSQRVEPPEGTGDQPVESIEQQQQIVQRLQAMYNASSSMPDVNSSSEATSIGTTTSNGSSALAAAVLKPAAYTGPLSQVTRTLTILETSKIKIGLDMQRAGAISWLSSPRIPSPWTGKNLVNIWDQGRLLQQSYYGCVDGSCWAERPWLWNPVQGGSWQNQPGVTTKQQVTPGKQIFVEGNPRNWGKQDLIKQVLMTSTVTVGDGYAKVGFAVKYTGTVTHPYMTQEVPAVFIDRRFSVLAFYNGSKPWTNDKKISYVFPPGRNIYAKPTEFWAAYLDPVSGWGVGVLNSKAWMGITAYRIGPDGSDKPWDTCYFAHTIRMQLHAGMKPYMYTVYITIGRLDTIRATFGKLVAAAGVMPARGGETRGEMDSLPPSTGQPDLGRNEWYGRVTNYSDFTNVIGISVNNDSSVMVPNDGWLGGPDTDDDSDDAAAGADNSDGRTSGVTLVTADKGTDASRRSGVIAGVVIGAAAGYTLLAGVGFAVNKAMKAARAQSLTSGGRNAPAASTGSADNGTLASPGVPSAGGSPFQLGSKPNVVPGASSKGGANTARSTADLSHPAAGRE